MHSKQTQIAKFNFVQCFTNYSKSSAVHIANEQSVVLHKFSWFVATMDWMRFLQAYIHSHDIIALNNLFHFYRG